VTDQTRTDQAVGSAPRSGTASASANPTDDALRQLGEYLEGARWFGGKGRGVQANGVRRLGVIADEGPRVVVDLVEVTYDGPSTRSGRAADTDLYQLPLALYTDPQHRLDHAFVGWWEDPDIGWVHAYDAVHDREAMAAYLRAFAFPPDGSLVFKTRPGVQLDPEAPSTPLSAEQSNSSVMFGEEALLKVFRRVTPGTNPDIEIHDVLTRAGSDNVAALFGWIEWEPMGGVQTGAERLHQPAGSGPVQLAMLQQFLRTASDGWELALASVRNLFAEADLYADEVGGDFAAEAQRLGEAVGHIHRLLAEHFPTAERSAPQQAELASAMIGRLEAAIQVVPELADHESALRALFEAVGSIGAGAIQRIHGDLHLGQTLRTAKGWKIVDFEGEPAKPLSERVTADSPWRDVAGMLRSFDYAPRVAAMTAATTDDEGSEQRAYRAAEWSARNQAAFLEAYAGRALTEEEQTLLAAYVADKAVYECVYEARNRPSWLPIPMAALPKDPSDSPLPRMRRTDTEGAR
jgi:maltokinase